VHGLSVQNNQGPNASGQRTPSTIQPLFCKENYENTIAINTLLNGRNTKKLTRNKKWSFLKQ
jgi:hypothetical protein